MPPIGSDPDAASQSIFSGRLTARQEASRLGRNMKGDGAKMPVGWMAFREAWMSSSFALEWAATYKRSWETLDTELFVSLFTSTALYYPTPFSEPYRAKDLGRLWNTLKKLQRDNHIDLELWQSRDGIAAFRWEGESTRLP